MFLIELCWISLSWKDDSQGRKQNIAKIKQTLATLVHEKEIFLDILHEYTKKNKKAVRIRQMQEFAKRKRNNCFSFHSNQRKTYIQDKIWEFYLYFAI